MIVTLDNKVFVMEFKLSQSIKDVERLTDEAIKTSKKSPKYGIELIEGDGSCPFFYIYILVIVFIKIKKERNINKISIENYNLNNIK